ncbi:hypothetical protein EI94DRAFT_1703149 [Lactarius quietus]|nr:hypothetical protein EI94DRAFT_1703149 [Lactarius quietus]
MYGRSSGAREKVEGDTESQTVKSRGEGKGTEAGNAGGYHGTQLGCADAITIVARLALNRLWGLGLERWSSGYASALTSPSLDIRPGLKVLAERSPFALFQRVFLVIYPSGCLCLQATYLRTPIIPLAAYEVAAPKPGTNCNISAQRAFIHSYSRQCAATSSPLLGSRVTSDGGHFRSTGIARFSDLLQAPPHRARLVTGSAQGLYHRHWLLKSAQLGQTDGIEKKITKEEDEENMKSPARGTIVLEGGRKIWNGTRNIVGRLQ